MRLSESDGMEWDGSEGVEIRMERSGVRWWLVDKIIQCWVTGM